MSDKIELLKKLSPKLCASLFCVICDNIIKNPKKNEQCPFCGSKLETIEHLVLTENQEVRDYLFETQGVF